MPPAHTRSVIFVSSVQAELKAERRAIKDFVHHDPLLSRFFDVFLFEDMPASGQRADQVYLLEVDRCAVYLAVLGEQYGSEDASGISPTEREFERVTATGKERLVFVKGSADSSRHPKMQVLVRRASGEVIRRRFSALPELTAGLYASLVARLARTGEIRTLPFDAAACPRATIADLSPKKVEAFLRLAQSRRGYALGPETPMQEALVHLNLFDGDLPSHAAVMLFANEPQRFLPTSFVKCLRFHGTEIRKPIPAYSSFNGTVFELVDQAVDFVMAKLDRAVGTRAASNQTPETYELPPDAVSEAIVNAIAHRDYTSNASVQIMLFADRLEIWNPGELFPPLTVESLRRPHPSLPRNPLIAEPLFLTRYIERAGTGTLDMIELCRAAGLPPPEFRQEQGQVIQILRRPVKTDSREDTQQVTTQDKVLAGAALDELAALLGVPATQVTTQVTTHVAKLLRAAAEAVTRDELQGATELQNREHFRQTYLAPLVSGGWLELTIPDKPTSPLQKYRLTAKGRAWLEQTTRS